MGLPGWLWLPVCSGPLRGPFSTDRGLPGASHPRTQKGPGPSRGLLTPETVCPLCSWPEVISLSLRSRWSAPPVSVILFTFTHTQNVNVTSYLQLSKEDTDAQMGNGCCKCSLSVRSGAVQTDRQTDRWRDGQQTDRWAGRHTDRQTHRQADEWTDDRQAHMDGQTDRQIDGETAETHRQTHSQTDLVRFPPTALSSSVDCSELFLLT